MRKLLFVLLLVLAAPAMGQELPPPMQSRGANQPLPMQPRSADHRADFERERERADRRATRRAELFPQYRHFSSRPVP
jgi:hypothetical protein